MVATVGTSFQASKFAPIILIGPVGVGVGFGDGVGEGVTFGVGEGVGFIIVPEKGMVAEAFKAPEESCGNNRVRDNSIRIKNERFFAFFN